MALQGNLRDFTITQLLNLINLANKSGGLLVQDSSQKVRLIFREGKLAFAQLDNSEAALPNVLHSGGKLSDAQLRTLEQRAAEMSDKELGLLLINAGYVTQADILESLQTYFTGIVNKLLTWVEGQFRFEEGVEVPENRIALRIPLENLIMEGSRQLRELEQLQFEVPNLDMALAFTDRPGVNLKKVNLNVEEWRVVSYINPKNSLRQIAKATQMNDLQIRRIVYGLLQAGLVKFVRPSGAPAQLEGLKTAFPGVEKPEEQKGLVNRLIERIRSI
ncbi:MAG TPA: DUF4388 domain-containing protein [Anaerolineales bacterium]